jgi:hypothetical protein
MDVDAEAAGRWLGHDAKLGYMLPAQPSPSRRHWVIHVDPRGERTFRYRCNHVNLLEKTVECVEEELEFLSVT